MSNWSLIPSGKSGACADYTFGLSLEIEAISSLRPAPREMNSYPFCLALITDVLCYQAKKNKVANKTSHLFKVSRIT